MWHAWNIPPSKMGLIRPELLPQTLSREPLKAIPSWQFMRERGRRYVYSDMWKIEKKL